VRVKYKRKYYETEEDEFSYALRFVYWSEFL
jgi:hypothetical protein